MSLDDPEFTLSQPEYGHAQPGHHKRRREGNDGWSWDRDEEMEEQKKVSYTTNPGLPYLNYRLTLNDPSSTCQQ